MVITVYWLLPEFSDYADRAHCYDYGFINGLEIVFYGLFVGIPLLAAVVLLALEGRRAVKVLRLGQNPLPGEKVLKKVRYRYGWVAKIQPVVIFAMIAFCLGFSVWGVFAATALLDSVTADASSCL